MNRSRLFIVQDVEIVNRRWLRVKPPVGAVEHVGRAVGEDAILRIRDDEGAGGGMGFDFGQLGVESFHLTPLMIWSVMA
jgi:hypothetical protein